MVAEISGKPATPVEGGREELDGVPLEVDYSFSEPPLPFQVSADDDINDHGGTQEAQNVEEDVERIQVAPSRGIAEVDEQDADVVSSQEENEDRTLVVENAYVSDGANHTAVRHRDTDARRRMIILQALGLRTAPLVSCHVIRGDGCGAMDEKETCLLHLRYWIRMYKCSLVVMSIAALLIAAVLISLLLKLEPESGNISEIPALTPTLEPTLIPRSARFMSFKEVLTNISSLSSFTNESSAQFRALQWLSDQDGAKLSTGDAMRLVQRYVLAVLFYSTGGESSWRVRCHFLPNIHECLWWATTTDAPHRGVICNNRSEVVGINLGYNNITGAIPAEIHALQNLVGLQLNSNNLHGSIPTSLTSLSKLRIVCMENNTLSCAIPSSIGNLRELQQLELSNNKLNSTIPPSTGKLQHLKVLDLYNNEITGTLPSSLGNLSILEGIFLGVNSITGTLPSALFLLPRLEDLSIYSNHLHGTLPMFHFNSQNLRKLTLWGNNLSGKMPSSLGTLPNLKVLELCENQFTGTIPESLANNAQLKILLLYLNRLSGSIPPSIFSLPSLEGLAIGHNQFTGSIPHNISNRKGILAIGLEANCLTGTIPESFGNLDSLMGLSLHSNLLTGSIPLSISNNTELVILELANNSLTSTVPSFENLTNLEWLSLARNNLIGNLNTTCQSHRSEKQFWTADCAQPNPEISCDCCWFCCNDAVDPCDFSLPVYAYVKECLADRSCYGWYGKL